MKISELIAKLEVLKAEHGDLECKIEVGDFSTLFDSSPHVIQHEGEKVVRL